MKQKIERGGGWGRCGKCGTSYEDPESLREWVDRVPDAWSDKDDTLILICVECFAQHHGYLQLPDRKGQVSE